jgi:phosphopantothenoylcysteine decarboxylase / phosphopantothenate---cysteine ligase
MKTVVVGLSGGIAAYKTAELVSRLKKAGFNVHCIMTRNACEFIAPLTLETLSGNPVIVDMFKRETPWEIEHITLAKKADIMVIAPATANVIGKIANGIADDMLSTTVMATTSKILIVPAMNVAMYKNKSVQDNLSILKNRGYYFKGPERGLQACGDDDIGRMSEPVDIVDRIKEILDMSNELSGKKIIITAGPTVEQIDPVRYITNHSSGKMGYAITEAALDAGAEVTLITGPTNLAAPKGVEVVNITSTNDMYDAVMDRFKDSDALIAAAAPADFKPEKTSHEKIKKSGGAMSINLTTNPDIAVAAGKKKTHQKIIVFAAESQNLIENAKSKLKKKNADLIIANDITKKGAGFAGETNIASIIDKNGNIKNLDIMPKSQLAKIIIKQLINLFKDK